jgi:predicted  nucleic acid-binding Zn-ribbon protein
MEKSLDELLVKIKTIKEEVDKVEFRVLNTRTHMETIEKSTEKIGKEILEGFHIVSNKVNHLEEEMKKVEKLLEDLQKNNK